MLNSLRGLNWPALGAALAFVAVAYGAPCFSPDGTPSHQPNLQIHHLATDAQNAANDLLKTAKPPASNKADGNSSEIGDGNCLPCLLWKALKFVVSWWLQSPDGFFAGWVAIFTLSLAILGFYQLSQMRTDATTRAKETADQIQLARDEFEANHRPWLSVDADPRGDLKWGDDGGITQLKLSIKNHGNTPAQQAYVLQRIVFAGEPRTPVDIQNELLGLGRTVDRGTIGATIFPTETHVEFHEVKISKADIEKIGAYLEARGSKAPYLTSVLIVGCVDYLSPFDATKHFQTAFAFRVVATGPEQQRINPQLMIGSDIMASDLGTFRETWGNKAS